MDWLVGLFIAVLGLVFGSFGNVVIWRLPRDESLNFPASHCTSCGTPILWHDDVPVLGWVMLRGKCRSCGSPISSRYPVVESLSGILWVAAYLKFGLGWRLVFAIAFFYLLMLLSFIDLDVMRLPNVVVALLAVVGAFGVGIGTVSGAAAVPLIDGPGALSSPFVAAVVGLLLGGLVPLSVALAYSLIRKAQGLGMGDVKLLAAMGLFLGPYVLLSLFLGSVIGAVASVAVGTGKGLDRRIPFGPFLACGGVVTALAGEQMVSWYLSLV